MGKLGMKMLSVSKQFFNAWNILLKEQNKLIRLTNNYSDVHNDIGLHLGVTFRPDFSICQHSKVSFTSVLIGA